MCVMSDEFGFNQQPNGQQPPQGEQAQYGQAPYGQPQYGGQAQYSYAPPPPQGPAYVPGLEGKGAGWIGLLRVILWIYFGLVCVVGLVLFVGFSAVGGPGFLAGLLALAGCVLLAFVSVAGGMVALDAAQNIRRTAINSARILEMLNKK